jgi:hypothetical protein
MGMNNSSCCRQMSFKRLDEPLADPGKAESVEFTLGSCTHCKQFLMHCWVAGGVGQGYEVVDKSFVDQLRLITDYPSREKMLADWWNSLESHGRTSPGD